MTLLPIAAPTTAPNGASVDDSTSSSGDFAALLALVAGNVPPPLGEPVSPEPAVSVSDTPEPPADPVEGNDDVAMPAGTVPLPSMPAPPATPASAPPALTPVPVLAHPRAAAGAVRVPASAVAIAASPVLAAAPPPTVATPPLAAEAPLPPRIEVPLPCRTEVPPAPPSFELPPQPRVEVAPAAFEPAPVAVHASPALAEPPPALAGPPPALAGPPPAPIPASEPPHEAEPDPARDARDTIEVEASPASIPPTIFVEFPLVPERTTEEHLPEHRIPEKPVSVFTAPAPMPWPVTVTSAEAPVPADAPAATPVAPPAVPEQIVSAVVPLHGRGDGRHEVTLELRPDDLGTIRVEVSVEHQIVHLTLHAAEPATGRLLSAALADLRSVLADAGLQAGHVTVSPDGGNGTGRRSRPQAEAETRLPDKTTPTSTIPATTPIPRPATAGRLDLFL